MYRHELDDLFLYYNASEDALLISPHESHGLLRVEKKSGSEISSGVDYTSDRLFDFFSWKQWDPLHNEFVESATNSVVKPICVDESFGFCTSGILHPNVGDVDSYSLEVSGPGDPVSRTSLDLRKMHFKLRPGMFHNIRPVYELRGDIPTIPYYLYHQNGKWRVGAEIGSASAVLEMESDAMRVEYEQRSEWHAVSSDGRRRSVFRQLQCRRQLPADVNCQSASNDVCLNGGSCRIDSAGISSCICPADFRGIRCQQPVAQCKQPLPSSSPLFAFGNREGSVASRFCPTGKVLLSVCDGVDWWPRGAARCPAVPTAASLVISAMSLANTSSEDRKRNATSSPDDESSGFSGRHPPGKIALVVACLVGLQIILPFLCYFCISCCKYDENKLSVEETTPARRRLVTFVRACSAFFYVSWWAWLAYLFYYLFAWHMHIALDGTTIWSAVAIMAIVCVCLLYVVVLCESICSREYEYLTKLKDIASAEEEIARMKLQSPSIKFKAECWHPETRTRTVRTCCTFIVFFAFSPQLCSAVSFVV